MLDSRPGRHSTPVQEYLSSDSASRELPEAAPSWLPSTSSPNYPLSTLQRPESAPGQNKGSRGAELPEDSLGPNPYSPHPGAWPGPCMDPPPGLAPPPGRAPPLPVRLSSPSPCGGPRPTGRGELPAPGLSRTSGQARSPASAPREESSRS